MIWAFLLCAVCLTRCNKVQADRLSVFNRAGHPSQATGFENAADEGFLLLVARPLSLISIAAKTATVSVTISGVISTLAIR